VLLADEEPPVVKLPPTPPAVPVLPAVPEQAIDVITRALSPTRVLKLDFGIRRTYAPKCFWLIQVLLLQQIQEPNPDAEWSPNSQTWSLERKNYPRPNLRASSQR
jgi:hypothetical protein